MSLYMERPTQRKTTFYSSPSLTFIDSMSSSEFLMTSVVQPSEQRCQPVRIPQLLCQSANAKAMPNHSAHKKSQPQRIKTPYTVACCKQLPQPATEQRQRKFNSNIRKQLDFADQIRDENRSKQSATIVSRKNDNKVSLKEQYQKAKVQRQPDLLKEFDGKNNGKMSLAESSHKNDKLSNQSRIPRRMGEGQLVEITNLPQRSHSRKTDNALHMKTETNPQKVKHRSNTAPLVAHQMKLQLPADSSKNRNYSETVPQLINQLRNIVHTMDENLSDVKDLITRLTIDLRSQGDNERERTCYTFQRSRSGV